MPTVSRRDFMKGAAVGAGALAVGGSLVPARAATRSVADLVTLGNTDVKLTRMAIGSGTFSGRVQRAMGQDGFTRLVRHAYDRGIRFFDTAEGYRTHGMMAEALKGIPRDSYALMTKYSTRGEEEPFAKLDRFRQELNTDYFDIVLLHCMRSADWSAELESLRDAFSEAKQKGIVRAIGASCHGLKPLRTFAASDWLEVSLNRINHNGTRMDSEAGGEQDVGDVDAVTTEIAKIHAAGKGTLGMKIIGEGAFSTTEARDESFKKVIGMGTVNAVTIGFASIEEFDDAFDRMNRHLNA